MIIKIYLSYIYVRNSIFSYIFYVELNRQQIIPMLTTMVAMDGCYITNVALHHGHEVGSIIGQWSWHDHEEAQVTLALVFRGKKLNYIDL